MRLLSQRVNAYTVLLDVDKFTYKNFAFSPAMCEEYLFLPQPCQECVVKCFTFCQSDKRKIMYQCSWISFLIYAGYSVVSFLENVLSLFLLDVWSFLSSIFKSHFCIRDIKPLSLVYVTNIFTIWSSALDFAYGIFCHAKGFI